MATVSELENIPCNEGYIFSGQKIYGVLPASLEQKVQLLDVDTEKVHVWHRNGHTVFTQKEEKLCYESSEQMLPCPYEAKDGKCTKRFESEHHKFFYHYCHVHPRVYNGKPVCRYSLVKKDRLCWEYLNAEHNKNYHHF